MAIMTRPLSDEGRRNHERIFGKHKKRQKGKFILDSKGVSVVKCERRSPGVQVQPDVQYHEVVGTHEQLVLKGSKQDRIDALNRAYENHPDPDYRGRFHAENL